NLLGGACMISNETELPPAVVDPVKVLDLTLSMFVWPPIAVTYLPMSSSAGVGVGRGVGEPCGCAPGVPAPPGPAGPPVDLARRLVEAMAPAREASQLIADCFGRDDMCSTAPRDYLWRSSCLCRAPSGSFRERCSSQASRRMRNPIGPDCSRDKNCTAAPSKPRSSSLPESIAKPANRRAA